MKIHNNKTKLLIGASLLTAVLAGCRQYDTDGAIVTVRGKPYELQHLIFDAYVLHELDAAEIAATKEKLEAIRDR